MNIIKNKNFSSERALYALKDTIVENCTFAGEEDGESAFKETANVEARSCTFELRYPFWHAKDFKIVDSTMTETCRAALWYCRDGKIEGCRLNGVKALRECTGIEIRGTESVSAEFGWKCKDIRIKDSSLESDYIFLDSKNIELSKIKMKGKYSFQYVENMRVSDSYLDTKDAFWHAKNIVVENSTVIGAYIGWYSDGLTLRNCKIVGTQPFCYAKNLVLENCEMVDCDLSFEYSDVTADVKGNILSVKNPRSGRIVADSIGEIIKGNAVYPCDAEIVIR